MRTCKQCGTDFEVTDADREFYKKVSPTFGGRMYLIPEPTLCPTCRQKRRLIWRNERSLYQRKCGLCQKSIVTLYSPDKPFTVYCRDCWWGDGWDRDQYGRDFDFNRPFFEQFRELLIAVPKAAVMCINIENCQYTNFQNDSRNCYLTFASGFMEDCQYCDWVYHAKNTFDCSFCDKSELDYMNVDCSETYHSKFSQDCHVISDCQYCYDCRNCKNCFGCIGLRGKEYHLFNKPVSREQYESFMEKLKDPKFADHIKDEFTKLKMSHSHVSSRLINSENCTGDDIENCQNCLDSYGIKECQDCRFTHDAFQMKDCYDNNRNGISELCYETLGGGYYQQVQFMAIGAYLSFAQYCYETMNAKYAFGCVGLNHQDYYVLNKKYSKEEYEKLVPRIIEHMKETGEWGEFFPPSICPFAYNETLAQEFFPLDESSAKTLGHRWMPKDQKEYRSQTVQVPADIKDVPDTITNEVLACTVTGRNFQITPQELKFYREQGLPIPSKHPNQRYLERLALKNPRQLWDRNCAKCQVALQTAYSPEQPEIVYCEKCYLQEIY